MTDYKETQVGLLPADWAVISIGEATTVSAGGTPDTTVEAYWSPPEIPWMSSGEVHKRRIFHTEKRISKLGLNHSAAKIFPKNTIVMALAGQGKTRGCVAVLEAAVATNQSLAGIYPSESFDADYLLQNLDWRYKELRMLSSGEGGRGGLNLTIIKGIQLAQPSLAEQKKIARILTAIDEKIQNITTQITATRALKKGLAQALIGNIKKPTSSKIYQKLGAKLGTKIWPTKAIGDVLTVVERATAMESEEYYRRVTVKRRFGGIVLRDELPGADIKVKSQFIIQAGDFLISERQIVHGACGIVPPELDGALVSNEYLVLTANEGFDTTYFDYLVQLLPYSKLFLLCSQGVDKEKFLFKSKDWLRKEIPVPPFAEQKKIGLILKTVDEKIAILLRKQEKYQTLKRGLMQKLLSGEWRVKCDDATAAQ